MSRVKRMLLPAVLAGLWLVLLVFSLFTAADIGGTYPAVSMRYTQALTGRQASDALRHAAGLPQEEAFWPTFWSQQELKLSSELAATDAKVLFYKGDPTLVWKADFMRGGYPGQLDVYGCAISEGLAWKLFGGADVVGLPITVEEKNYIVRGVFAGEDAIALLHGGESEDATWQNAEIPLTKPMATDEDALLFAQNAGLGMPQHKVSGAAISGIARVAALLPVVFAVVLCVVLQLYRWRYWLRTAKGQMVAFIVLLVLALGLPILLGRAPAWLVPTRWSDFSYWGNLARHAGAGLKSWWALPPTLKDVIAKGLLLRQGLLLVLQMTVGVPLCIKMLGKPAAMLHNTPFAKEAGQAY